MGTSVLLALNLGMNTCSYELSSHPGGVGTSHVFWLFPTTESGISSLLLCNE